MKGFDHPVIAVKNLSESHAVYSNLGFTIPPRGSHIEWGTGNWCIMFQKNYLEHRGIIDADRYTHGLENFLAEREGLLGTAFRSDLDNRDLYKNAVAAGLNPTEPQELTRNFELKTGKVPVSFRLVFFNKDDIPALMASLVCEHLTPELLRKPEYLVHPNTAYDIFEMTSVVETLDGISEQLKKLFAEEAVEQETDQIKVTLPDGGTHRVLVNTRAEKEGLILPNVVTPYLSSCGISIRDRTVLKHILEQNNVPFVQHGSLIRVSPENACGLYLDFAEK
ncbi:VOC family protein [Acinetobacter sp. Res13-Abat-PEC09-P3-02]|uniref:VOC family protein n=1 Tax=Acinetobacter sp. Res13-Abat-PEC09-P3-02 TaxID=2777949 RepID=UPI001F5B7042|nr:VOC family protein [Acinetobacter sp. Res13-Abat-PEC09-P3-02]